MKELEVKAMLADPNIPDDYKLGGRLDDRFLDGVEYAERMMEKAPELWIARDKAADRIYLYEHEPTHSLDVEIFEPDYGGMIELPKEAFPEVTWENSPRKVRLILEDKE